MRTILSTNFVKVVDNVTVNVDQRVVTVVGPRGTLKKTFKHANLEIEMSEDSKTMRVDAWFANRKELAVVRTVCSHVKNMMTGVTLGYLYKLRLVYAHFPINTVVADGGKKIEIRNFLGEKITRVVKAYPGAKISLSKDVKEEILVEANDIEMVSLTAARIQQVCDVKKKDIRKFLDGIYVSEKTTVILPEL